MAYMYTDSVSCRRTAASGQAHLKVEFAVEKHSVTRVNFLRQRVVRGKQVPNGARGLPRHEEAPVRDARVGPHVLVQQSKQGVGRALQHRRGRGGGRHAVYGPTPLLAACADSHARTSLMYSKMSLKLALLKRPGA